MRLISLLFGVLLIMPFGYLNASEELQRINKGFLFCTIEFNNTGDDKRYEVCSSEVFKDLDFLIKNNRSKSGYANKQQWKKTNTGLAAYKQTCEINAQKTQTNSTIKKDILSCNLFYLRSLALESEKLI